MHTPMKNQLFQLSIATREGQFVARYSAKGLAELNFPVGRPSSAVAPLRRVEASPRAVKTNGVPTRILRSHRKTVAALKNALAGCAAKNLPPLDLSAGTEFQQKVWNALRKISAGKTKSYGEIAEAVGKPKAVRAVGGACGANPIPIFVPCHRVLAANNKLGGFSGGLSWKRTLLAREGASFR
jgi:O-6-methylguanine DNA methyltransferase